ncbi:MAG: Hsp20/alpha crystallin family protein [Desulfovibrionaceae bacterium]|nr:Hsp20/alpha crystallin family protein [Desulfovibrionaceae bacterium]
MADLKHWSRGEIARMRSEMDRLFDELCSDFDLPVMFCRIAGDLDLREEGDVLVVRLKLGNMNPDDVRVSVLERRLIISAEYADKRGGVRSMRTFRKELRLPCIIRTDEVDAAFKDGVLTVRLPKCVSQIGQRINIIR